MHLGVGRGGQVELFMNFLSSKYDARETVLKPVTYIHCANHLETMTSK